MSYSVLLCFTMLSCVSRKSLQAIFILVFINITWQSRGYLFANVWQVFISVVLLLALTVGFNFCLLVSENVSRSWLGSN